MKSKRGISALVATTILVAIVVLSVSVFTFWGKGYIKDMRQKAGVDVDQLNCNGIQLQVNERSGAVEVTNDGVDLSGVAVQVRGEGDPFSTVYPQEIKRGSSKSFPYRNVPGISRVEKVNVIPLLGMGLNRPCSDQRVELKL